MKFAVTGAKNTGKIRELVKRHGFEIDQNAPDFVISYGGDGSILYAEREYPGVPKITVQASSTGVKCIYPENKLERVLEKIKRKEYTIAEEMKLEAEAGGRKFGALNEIQIHNKFPVKAVRFAVHVDGGIFFERVVGDGVVISTPFGSTAYYSSVGGKKFARGIGIALNNPHNHKEKRAAVVDAASEIRIKILRDESILISDNLDRFFEVKEGDEVVVRRAKDSAKFVVVK